MTTRSTIPFPAGAARFLLAVLLSAASGAARATDVLVLWDKSPRGLWTLELEDVKKWAPAGRGSIQVENKGKVLITLRSPGDRIQLTSGMPYLLVFHRESDDTFAQQFRLVDGKRHARSFVAEVSHNHPQGGKAQVPAEEPTFIRIRLSRHPDGSLPGSQDYASLDNTIHYVYDSYVMEIVADEFPPPW
jgi:hypothetical protein